MSTRASTAAKPVKMPSLESQRPKTSTDSDRFIDPEWSWKVNATALIDLRSGTAAIGSVRPAPMNMPTRGAEQDIVVTETPGVVVGIDQTENTVFVKIDANEVTVSFPQELFRDYALLKYGQLVTYQIRERADRTRFQVIAGRESTLPLDMGNDIDDILSKIRFRKDR